MSHKIETIRNIKVSKQCTRNSHCRHIYQKFLIDTYTGTASARYFSYDKRDSVVVAKISYNSNIT